MNEIQVHLKSERDKLVSIRTVKLESLKKMMATVSEE